MPTSGLKYTKYLNRGFLSLTLFQNVSTIRNAHSQSSRRYVTIHVLLIKSCGTNMFRGGAIPAFGD